MLLLLLVRFLVFREEKKYIVRIGQVLWASRHHALFSGSHLRSLSLPRSPVSNISFPERPIGKKDGSSRVDHSAEDATPGAETSARIWAPLLPAPTTATLFPRKSSAERYWLLWIWVPRKVSDPGRRGQTGEA